MKTLTFEHIATKSVVLNNQIIEYGAVYYHKGVGKFFIGAMPDHLENWFNMDMPDGNGSFDQIKMTVISE